jgi:hypothetical protein
LFCFCHFFSTGGGAALLCASKNEAVKAVVSRGGRPDLCPEENLKSIKCPVLLLVGSLDQQVLTLNESAAKSIKNVQVTVIKDATHLFEGLFSVCALVPSSISFAPLLAFSFVSPCFLRAPSNSPLSLGLLRILAFFLNLLDLLSEEGKLQEVAKKACEFFAAQL